MVMGGSAVSRFQRSSARGSWSQLPPARPLQVSGQYEAALCLLVLELGQHLPQPGLGDCKKNREEHQKGLRTQPAVLVLPVI